jgi:hypothetical protein
MKLLKSLDLNDLVFLNIETTPLVEVLEEFTLIYDSWVYKCRYEKELIDDGKKSYQDLFTEKAQYYPEFSRIKSINIGKIKDDVLKIKTFDNADEKELLTEFNKTMVNIIANSRTTRLCGNFIIGYAIPFINVRSIINQVESCSLIDVNHCKPWELTAVDINTLWKGPSIRSASLINIATSLGLPFIKDFKEELTTVANIVRLCRFEPILEVEEAELKEKQVGVLQRTFNTKTLNKADEKKLLKTITDLPEDEKEIANELLKIAVQ